MTSDTISYFNSRPCGRGDACCGAWQAEKTYFNSRPCGRGDAAKQVARWMKTISIHAPAGGATGFATMSAAGSMTFQFTPLREGRPFGC